VEKGNIMMDHIDANQTLRLFCQAWIEKSKAAGMDAHLAKPIEPERLFQTLYDFIFGKEA